MAIDWVSFGKIIREHRERLGYRQSAYADLLGLQQGQLSQLEAGNIKKPAYETIQILKRQVALDRVPGETVPAVITAQSRAPSVPRSAAPAGRLGSRRR